LSGSERASPNPEVAVSTLAATRILPRTRLISVLLVIAFAALTAILAQVRVAVWFTPVPFTGQTFAVLASGLVLGWRRGIAAQALYLAAGAIGLPVFQGANGGWSYVTGSTFGYLVGFVAAAAIAGFVARTVTTRGAGFIGAIAGTGVIYVFGVTWLAHSLGIDIARAIQLGMVPFLVGDAVKAMLAGMLPNAHRQ
jgi:biotin transport system substrate-specific component